MSGAKLRLFMWQGQVAHLVPGPLSHGAIQGASAAQRGALYAVSAAQARLSLRRSGVRPQRLRASGKQASEGDKSLFMRQLALLIAARVPLYRALEILLAGARGAKKWPLSALIQVLLDTVASGKPLHKGLSKTQAHWSVLHTSLVQAGEESGTLAAMLAQLADYMEEKNNLQQTLRSAAIYPLTVLVASAVLMAVFIGFIIPTFAAMYQDSQASLPWPTQLAIEIANLGRSWLPWMVLAMLLLLWAAWGVRRSTVPRFERWHETASQRVLTLPLIGRVFQKAAIARWAQSSSVMLGAGLVLTQVLPIALASTQRFAYQRALASIQDTVLSGQSLSRALASHPVLFDSVSQQMVTVGEETGALSELLAKLATLYASEVRQAIAYAQKLLQPAIVVFLGGLISALLLALYLPIFQMGQMV